MQNLVGGVVRRHWRQVSEAYGVALGRLQCVPLRGGLEHRTDLYASSRGQSPIRAQTPLHLDSPVLDPKEEIVRTTIRLAI